MNYIDLTCPAEIFRTAMPTEEVPAATLTLFNLSDRVITSVEVLLHLLDEDGGETERLAFRGRALNGRPHSTFLLTVPCAPAEGLKSITASIEKVWYADNETWRRDPAAAVEYVPNNLPVSPALTNLKYAAGETAVGYPSQQDGLWVCVCGRPNTDETEYCVRCGRDRKTIFTRFSPEAVEAQISMKERQLDLNSRSMREDTIRLQRIREEEYRQKKDRRGSRIRTGIAVIAAAALTAGVLFFASPWLRLCAGRNALEEGKPAEAKAIFSMLGTYGGADEMISECDWRIALKAAEEGTTAEALAEASAMLRAVDKPEAVDKANETDLIRARMLMEQGDWQGTLDALAPLPGDYDGRTELDQKANMARAAKLKADGSYDDARTIFLSLGSYPGAREEASACLYEPAKELMAQKNWDGAIDKLSGIPDYQDSRELTLECHYHKAEDLLEDGDPEGASREFLLAGNWGDAPTRCKSLTYAQAEEKYAAGDIKSAQSLYASIPDYLDSNTKDQECRYTLAEEAVAVREFTRTLELLSGVPDDYKKTAALRAEASYEKAKNAIYQEDWATAAELLGSMDREGLRRQYRDIEQLYLQACEGAGIDPYPTPAAEPEVPAETPVPAENTPEPEAAPTETPVPDPFLVTEDE